MAKLVVILLLALPVAFGAIPDGAEADSFSLGVSTGTVSVGVNLGAPPPMVLVPGLPVYRAPELPHNYFFYGGHYYLEQDGAWFAAVHYNGPWVVVHEVPDPVRAVPVTYYKIPPGQAKKGDGWKHAGGHGKGKR